VQSYKEARAALIATENSQAFDRQAVAAASAIEKRANELVGVIIKRMKRKFIASSKTRMDDNGSVVSGHFLGNVDLINETEFLKVAKENAQGARLHYHFNSCLRPEFLIKHSRGRESIYIRSTFAHSSEKAKEDAEISFVVASSAGWSRSFQ
jgi:adenosine deaminase CECR1